MAASHDNTTVVSPYRSGLMEIVDNLDDKEVRRLKFLCKGILPKAVLETADACDIIEALETHRKLSEENHTFLLSLLTKLKREDLKEKFLHEINPGYQEGPTTLSSIPGGPSPAGQSNTKRRPCSVDGSPISTSGQSTQQRSLTRSFSLQNTPSKQSSHVAARPKVRASSYHGEKFAGSANVSSPGTGQDGGLPTPSTAVMTGSQGSNPCGMSFSHQDLGSMTWPLKHRSEKKEFNNRRKVKKMEPMKELEAMNEAQRLDRIQEKQNDILEETQTAEKEAEQQLVTNLDKITIHCKECSALVCKASELRRKGNAGHVTCISPDFRTWVEEVRYQTPQCNQDSETVGLKCGTFHCRNNLGTLQKLLDLQSPDGYDLNAQSFEVHHEMGSVTIPIIWKEAGFRVLQG